MRVSRLVPVHLTLALVLALTLALALDLALAHTTGGGAIANKPLKLRRKSFASAVFSKNQAAHTNKTASCEWLNRLKHQSKLCWRRTGLATVLQNARKLAVKNCEEHFKYSQWNCTQRGRYFRRAYRETALMQSLSAAALTWGVARACREGTLRGCGCGGRPASTPPGATWLWGDCADNTHFARTFTRKFLQLGRGRGKGKGGKGKGGKGGKRDLAGHNGDVGVRLVARSLETACRCHGISGACAVKICYKKLKPFSEISQQLVARYHSAIQLQSANTSSVLSVKQNRNKLVYLDPSPNFCALTAGRRCSDTDNCATLCCGRGHYSDTVAVTEYCDCRFPPGSLQLACDTCQRNQTILRCK